MFDIEEFRDLEIAVKDHSPCDLSTIWSLQPVAVFLPPVIWVCLHLCLHRELRQKPCSVISWCVTVIEIGTSRKSTWHFLLVFLCNCLLSFSRYDDLLVENLDLPFFAIFTHPILVETIAWSVSLEPRVWNWSLWAIATRQKTAWYYHGHPHRHGSEGTCSSLENVKEIRFKHFDLHKKNESRCHCRHVVKVLDAHQYFCCLI